MSFCFKNQLKVGQFGEVLFFQAHQGTLNLEDGRKRDFSCAVTGAGIELKTDSYDMKSTPFFFMERFSDMEKETPGGPFQSLANGTEFFCYMYVSNLTFFKFRTDELVKRLEEVLPKCTAVRVQNKSWTTLGYKVPRELLKDLYEEKQLVVSVASSSP